MHLTGNSEVNDSTGTRSLPERPPKPGELVHVRSRRWLVEEVVDPKRQGQSPVVRLACADDDAQGQSLDVFWDYELDRKILSEMAIHDPKSFDAVCESVKRFV